MWKPAKEASSRCGSFNRMHRLPGRWLIAVLACSLCLHAFGSEKLPVPSSGNDKSTISAAFSLTPQKLIVIGFMGGRIRADDMRHREAQLARDLERRHPEAIRAIMFANHDGHAALRAVLRLFCEQAPSPNPEKCMSPEARHAARIIIFGHSWGASETVTLGRSRWRAG